MPRPSEPILALLRQTMQRRGMNTAALAREVGERRSAVRSVLSGRQPLTVDQLATWSAAMGLEVTDFASIPEPPSPGQPGTPALAQAPGEAEPGPMTVDPFGNHAEQAIRLAFAMGVDFSLVASSAELAGSGIPPEILERFPKGIPIRLDAAFHRFNQPRYDPGGIELVLSFGGVAHTCRFPWSSIEQLAFHLEPPPPEPEQPSPPGLHLVKG